MSSRPSSPIAPRTIPPCADKVSAMYRHSVTYFKSALGFKLLREQILGPDRFDPAFRRFIAARAYRHPRPSNYFRAMESEPGEDLGWWWRGWCAENGQMDSRSQGSGAPMRGTGGGETLVRVEARDNVRLPFET